MLTNYPYSAAPTVTVTKLSDLCWVVREDGEFPREAYFATSAFAYACKRAWDALNAVRWAPACWATIPSGSALSIQTGSHLFRLEHNNMLLSLADDSVQMSPAFASAFLRASARALTAYYSASLKRGLRRVWRGDRG